MKAIAAKEPVAMSFGRREKDFAGFSQTRGNELNSTDGSTPLGKIRGNCSESSRPVPRPTTSGKPPFKMTKSFTRTGAT